MKIIQDADWDDEMFPLNSRNEVHTRPLTAFVDWEPSYIKYDYAIRTCPTCSSVIIGVTSMLQRSLHWLVNLPTAIISSASAIKKPWLFPTSCHLPVTVNPSIFSSPVIKLAKHVL